MRTIPKDQIEGTLGKGSFWLPKQIVGISYLYGIPELDAVREAKSSSIPNPLNIKLLPEGLQIQIMHKFKHHTIGISFVDIKRIELAVPEDIAIKQERSVIGRAIIGGLLLGPIGAIVGGMSGLKDGIRTVSGDALLTFQIEQEGIESFFVGSVERSKQEVTKAFLQKHLSHLMN